MMSAKQLTKLPNALADRVLTRNRTLGEHCDSGSAMVAAQNYAINGQAEGNNSER
jgi:hypothetical protein